MDRYEALSVKYNRLQQIGGNVLNKFIQAGIEGNFHERHLKAWIHMMVIYKLQARILDDMEQRSRNALKYLDYQREKMKDPYYEQDDYIGVTADLMEYEERKNYNAKTLLDFAVWADQVGIFIDAAILRSALSISYEDWKQFEDHGKNLLTLLISKVGNEPLSWHITDCIFDEIDKSPEARKQLREKTCELFPGLFPEFLGGDADE